MNTERKEVRVADIEFMLHNGFTRTKDDKNYNAAIGSIEEHYQLSPEQVKLMFRDERLKKLRTKKVAVAQFVISEGPRTIDNLTTMQNTTVSMGTASTTAMNTISDNVIDETITEVELEATEA